MALTLSQLSLADLTARFNQITIEKTRLEEQVLNLEKRIAFSTADIAYLQAEIDSRQ
jgi:uncharacterized small protein (DUF1192 family)